MKGIKEALKKEMVPWVKKRRPSIPLLCFVACAGWIIIYSAASGLQQMCHHAREAALIKHGAVKCGDVVERVLDSTETMDGLFGGKCKDIRVTMRHGWLDPHLSGGCETPSVVERGINS